MPEPTPPPALALPPDRQTLAAQARQRRRLMQRLEMPALMLVGYALDLLLLLGLVRGSVLPPEMPWAYVAAGVLACAIFAVLLHGAWCEQRTDHRVVVPQMLVHSAIVLGFVPWVPQIGVWLLLLLFVYFAVAALRLALRPAVLGAFAVAALVAVLFGWVGEHLGLPVSGDDQRALSAGWFGLVLLRAALLGRYGAGLRTLLAKRSALLADTTQRLEQLASRDELTGALNRRAVLQLLEEERERAQRTGTPFGVALLDVDFFRQVNELHGTLVGDDVLRRFALKVAAELRATDRLGRMEGQRFVLLLTSVLDIEAAVAVAERVRTAVEQHAWSEVRRGLDVTASSGVAVSRPSESVEQLLARTELALQQAKHGGRNCVRAA